MDEILQVNEMMIQAGNFTLGPVGLSVRRGEIFAILGKTGAGKTLLMETVIGYYPKYSGDIAFYPRQGRSMGMVYQDYGLFPHINVRDNIAYGLKCRRAKKAEIARKVDEVSSFFGISHLYRQYPGTLSGGEKQRVALARTMILQPELLLLDEPFSALDVSTKEKIYTQIQEIQEAFSCTIVFITHDFTEARRLAHRIGIILDGRMEAIVEAEDLFEYHKNPRINAFLGLEWEYGCRYHGNQGII